MAGIIVAKTRDAGGSVLGSLGNPNLDWSGGGGNGVRYSSSLVNQIFTNMGFLKLAYKVTNQHSACRRPNKTRSLPKRNLNAPLRAGRTAALAQRPSEIL